MLKNPLSYLYLPILCDTWHANQNTGDGPPRSYSVHRLSIYTTGICLPTGLLHKHSQGAFLFPPGKKNRINNIRQTISIIKNSPFEIHIRLQDRLLNTLQQLYRPTTKHKTYQEALSPNKGTLSFKAAEGVGICRQLYPLTRGQGQSANLQRGRPISCLESRKPS